LVDEDTNAFNKIIDAVRMPKGTEEEKSIRHAAMQEATKYAVKVPLEVAQTSFDAMEVMLEMVEKGNPNSITDAGVGAMCARTAVLGAVMNAKINLADIEDERFKQETMQQCAKLEEGCLKREEKARKLVADHIG
ncbi:MAG: cyclodeaminase/cyclohydrolase family protein, partial [Flavobacteriales bacterium]|nr:cyclodeaminase/cyclohydrolase family protein [Flavobacteriales bacterium]